MSTGGGLVSLSGPERARYETLFAIADADQDGVIGPADAAWFLSLGMDKTTLSEVWRLADGERRGFLSKEEYFLALRLVALARQSRPLSIKEASLPTAPQFNAQQQQQQKPQAPLSSGSPAPPLSQGAKLDTTTSDEWSIAPAERAKFAEIFEKADDDKDGFVTGPQARQLFSRSGLDMEDLGRIWTLSDADQDHQLDMGEFIVAMYLINARLKGRQLPPALPPSLAASASGASLQAHQHHQQHNLQSPPSPAMQPLQSPAQLQSPPSQAKQPDHSSDEEYVMTPEERSKYEDVFTKADDDKDGFVSGEQARTMFSRSQLPLPDLAKIWTLADYGKDHRLDKDEFILAMYFINARLKGRRLPDVLPPNLVPAGAGHGPQHQMASPHSSLTTSLGSFSTLPSPASPPGSTGRPLSTYGGSLGLSLPMQQQTQLHNADHTAHGSPLPSYATPSSTYGDNGSRDALVAPVSSGGYGSSGSSGGGGAGYGSGGFGSAGGAPLMAAPVPSSSSSSTSSSALSPPTSSGMLGMGGLGGALSGSTSSLLASGGFGPSDSFDQLAASPARPPASSSPSSSRLPASPQLHASLQTATQREGEIKTRIGEVKALAQQQAKINDEFQRQIDAQLAKNEQLEEELLREEERANRLAEESQALSAEWEAKKAEGDATNAKLQSVAERSLAYAGKLQETQGRVQELTAGLAAEKEQLKKAEKEAKQRRKAAAKEEKELESLKAQVAALRNKKADAQNTRGVMEERVAAAREGTQQLRQEAAQLAEEVAALEADLAAKQQEVDEKEQQQRALDEQIHQLEMEKEQLRAAMAALELKSQQQQQQFQQQQLQLQNAGSLHAPPRSGPVASYAAPGSPSSFRGVNASPQQQQFSLSSSGSKLATAPQPIPFGGSDFFGGGGFGQSQGAGGGGQVNFFDMAVGAGGIDPVETRDFFGGASNMVAIPPASSSPSASPAAGGFGFDPFASFGESAAAPAGATTDFFSSDDAFA